MQLLRHNETTYDIKQKNYPRVGVTVISTRKLDTISWTVNVTKKEKLGSDTRLRDDWSKSFVPSLRIASAFLAIFQIT